MATLKVRRCSIGTEWRFRLYDECKCCIGIGERTTQLAAFTAGLELAAALGVEVAK